MLLKLMWKAFLQEISDKLHPYLGKRFTGRIRITIDFESGQPSITSIQKHHCHTVCAACTESECGLRG